MPFTLHLVVHVDSSNVDPERDRLKVTLENGAVITLRADNDNSAIVVDKRDSDQSIVNQIHQRAFRAQEGQMMATTATKKHIISRPQKTAYEKMPHHSLAEMHDNSWASAHPFITIGQPLNVTVMLNVKHHVDEDWYFTSIGKLSMEGDSPVMKIEPVTLTD